MRCFTPTWFETKRLSYSSPAPGEQEIAIFEQVLSSDVLWKGPERLITQPAVLDNVSDPDISGQVRVRHLCGLVRAVLKGFLEKELQAVYLPVDGDFAKPLDARVPVLGVRAKTPQVPQLGQLSHRLRLRSAPASPAAMARRGARPA